jgi:hypothetical protein
MTEYNTAERESSVTDERIDLQKRDVNALTEYMTVLPQRGDVYSVTTQSGSEYRVDALEGRCTCPDKQYNLDDGELCKHERRVRFATGQWAVPAWADTGAIDSQLGEHVTGTPEIAVTDGGVKTIGAEEPETDSTDKGRPADCDCHATFEELPCWPCYRDGFEAPNTKVKADE